MRDNDFTGLESSKKTIVRKIGMQNIIAILFLGTAGQIAWAVENSWFNTFVYDEITTDPAPVAWMVAVSAVTATLTTIIMGTLSDRTAGKMGRRKPYLIFGYIIWGIITAIYPMVKWIKLTGIAVVMVIVVDAIMTFFGSTSNDAAFNAWVTDIGHSSNRNRIQSLNSVSLYLAQIIAIGAAGIIIDKFGYFVFFYILGGFVSLVGLLSIFLVKSDPIKKDEIKKEKSFFREFAELLNPQILRENRILFLLFLKTAITGIAFNIYFPYLFIFLEHFVGFKKTEMSLYMGIFMVTLILFVVLFGILSHKYNRRTLIIIGTITNSIFTVLMGVLALIFGRGTPYALILFGVLLLGMIPSLASDIAHGGWLQDSYPEGNVGKFQGIRMIFFVAIPMTIGPPIGSALIRNFGIPTTEQFGFIPTPEIFIVGGIVALLALIPVFLIKKKEGKVKLEEVEFNK